MMMRILFKLQRKQWINALKSQDLKTYLAYVGILLALGMLLFGFSQTLWNIAGEMSDSIILGIFSYGLLVMVTSIILISMPQVFKHLYSATDLEFLFTLPIKTRHIFLSKYMQSFMGTPLFFFVFFLIPFIALGVAKGVSVIYYVVLFIVLLASVFAGLSIAYLLNLVVIQIIPASRANEIMTAISFLSGLAIYLLFMYPQMTNDRSYTEMIMEGLPILPDWIPVSWGSHAIVRAIHGEISLIIPLVLCLLFSVVLVLLATVFVEKGFRRGWIRLSEGQGRRKKRKTNQRHKVAISHPVKAIAKKEWLPVKRDLREWIAYLPLAFFIIFPLIGFFSGGGDIKELREMPHLTWPIAQIYLLFMYGLFNGQFAASSVAREGISVWILRTLPISGWHIALGKLWISWLIPFVILTVVEFVFGILLGWLWWQLILGLLIKACITIGISSIGIWIGTLGARYNPTNPQQRLTFITSIILLLLSYVYVMVMLFPYLLLLIPVEAAPFVAEVSQDTSGILGLVISFFSMFMTFKVHDPIFVIGQAIALLMILAIGVAWLFLKVSAARIDQGIDIDIVTSTKRSRIMKQKPGKSLY